MQALCLDTLDYFSNQPYGPTPRWPGGKVKVLYDLTTDSGQVKVCMTWNTDSGQVKFGMTWPLTQVRFKVCMTWPLTQVKSSLYDLTTDSGQVKVCMTWPLTSQSTGYTVTGAWRYRISRWDWLGRCRYTVTVQNSKSVLRLLSQCGSSTIVWADPSLRDTSVLLGLTTTTQPPNPPNHPTTQSPNHPTTQPPNVRRVVLWLVCLLSWPATIALK